MDFSPLYLAFLLPSGPEMVVILFIGIMLFGRRLPEVGRTVGRTVVQLRQGFNKLKDEMDLDEEVREVRDSFRETRDDLTQIAQVPHAIRDPGQVLKDLTDETLSSVVPDEVVEGVPDALFKSDKAPE